MIVNKGGGEIFFSSRRRHTRYWRDWSSDVCSADLPVSAVRRSASAFAQASISTSPVRASCATTGTRPRSSSFTWSIQDIGVRECGSAEARSEERRVGKEWRSRGSPYHYKKKSQLDS